MFIKSFFSSTDRDLPLKYSLGIERSVFSEVPYQGKGVKSDRLRVTHRVTGSREAKDNVVRSDQSGSGTPRPQGHKHRHRVTQKEKEEMSSTRGKASKFLIKDVTQPYTDMLSLICNSF